MFDSGIYLTSVSFQMSEVSNNVRMSNNNSSTETKKKLSGSKRRRRWGDAPPPATAVVSTNNNADQKPLDPAQKAAALQESIRARLAALKQGKQPPTKAPSTKRAKIYDLDLSITTPKPPTGIVPSTSATTKNYNLQKTATKKEEISNKPKKPSNPYLSHHYQQQQQQQQQDQKSKENQVQNDEFLLDERLAGGHTSKTRVRGKAWNFKEPGTFIALAEKKREKALNAQQAGFASGRKMGEFIQNTKGISSAAHYYGPGNDDTQGDLPPALLLQDDTMPLVMEWWDLEYVPNKYKKQITVLEGQALMSKTKQKSQNLQTTTTSNEGNIEDEESKDEEQSKNQALIETCFDIASLKYSKTRSLVQHPPPLQSSNKKNSENDDSKKPVLHLTKKERKRQRKLRREERQRELRDLQAVGIVPAPEPRLTLQNFMKVLGQQAVLDPSQMEQKVQQQIEARQLAHQKRNDERKLTKEQRAAKRDRKLFKNDNDSTAVAIFYVKDMSHTYHRTKVDLNAQQNKLTGGVLECQCNPANLDDDSCSKLSTVICEGGPKAIKRFIRLMSVRMKWKGEGLIEQPSSKEGEEPQKFNSNNECQLIWTGMAPKRVFKSFAFQSCTSPSMARSVLEAKGLGHYWDQVYQYHQTKNKTPSDEVDDILNIKLLSDDEDDIIDEGIQKMDES